MTPIQMTQLNALYPCLQALPELLALPLSEIPVKHFKKGSSLFDEGAVCPGIPFVMAGEVRVLKASASGRALYLYSVLAGESCVISQGCLLGQQHYNARGVVHTDVTLCMISKELFDQLLAVHAPFRRFVFALFAERFAELMILIEEVAFKRLDQRLARLLVHRAPVLNVTHQSLADDLGSVREIVTRLLHQFADDGWVALSRERISVLRPQLLATYAKQDA
jgi:CRP/FNR family transcriptional regulator